MHIADGILPVAWCGAAHAVTWTGVAFLSRDVEPPEIVRMGLVASAMFAISLVHFPLGGTSVHLGLYGLTGILLGARAFPVVVAALLFQSFLFQHGGLLTLGVNALNMGCGALLAAALWRWLPGALGFRSFLCGFAGIAAPALLLSAEFAAGGYGKGFFALGAAYAGAGLLEGFLTMVVVSFLQRARPALLAPAP